MPLPPWIQSFFSRPTPWREGLHPIAEQPGWAEALAAGDPLEPWWDTPVADTLRGGRPTATPVRALVAHIREIPDYEGPDYEITLVFPQTDRWMSLGIRFGYDTTHWMLSQPDQFGWFEARLGVQGETVTLLVDPGHAEVFGLSNPKIRPTLSQILELAGATDHPVEKEAWRYAAVDLVANAAATHRRADAVFGPFARELGRPVREISRELARRVRLNEDPEAVLSRLAEVLPDWRIELFAAD